MLRRSIPGYAALLQLIGIHAAETVMDGELVYDLGCSLGAASLSMRHALGSRNAHIIAVDNSPAMVERCSELVQTDSASCTTSVQLGDVRSFEIQRCSLVVMNFTLQFVPLEERLALLQRISRQLRDGGSLILSEKTKPSSGPSARFHLDMHDAFRRSNGYSQLELSRKREALEHVLTPQSESEHEAALVAAGLVPVQWFRCLQFVSWVATKGERK